ncbi:carboxypeptidase-like regulatory domain-containing protein [Pseudomonadota bacterium]
MLMLVGIMAAFFATPLLAQQTGEIAGKVTDASDGSPIAGVSIQATSPNLPGMRNDTTSANGFRKYQDNLDVQNFIALPKGKFHERPHPNGNIYSSGKYWE